MRSIQRLRCSSAMLRLRHFQARAVGGCRCVIASCMETNDGHTHHGRLRNGTSAAAVRERNSVHDRPWSLGGGDSRTSVVAVLRMAANSRVHTSIHGAPKGNIKSVLWRRSRHWTRVCCLAAVQGLMSNDEADVLAKCRRLRADKQQRCRELATYIAKCIKVRWQTRSRHKSTTTMAAPHRLLVVCLDPGR